LKKAFNLELYDRAINNPMVDQLAVTRDFLFGSYDQSRDRADEYMQEPQEQRSGLAQQAGIAPNQTTPLVEQLTGVGRRETVIRQ